MICASCDTKIFAGSAPKVVNVHVATPGSEIATLLLRPSCSGRRRRPSQRFFDKIRKPEGRETKEITEEQETHGTG